MSTLLRPNVGFSSRMALPPGAPLPVKPGVPRVLQSDELKTWPPELRDNLLTNIKLYMEHKKRKPMEEADAVAKPKRKDQEEFLHALMKQCNISSIDLSNGSEPLFLTLADTTVNAKMDKEFFYNCFLSFHRSLGNTSLNPSVVARRFAEYVFEFREHVSGSVEKVKLTKTRPANPEAHMMAKAMQLLIKRTREPPSAGLERVTPDQVQEMMQRLQM